MSEQHLDIQRKYYDEKQHSYLDFNRNDPYADNLIRHLISFAGIEKNDEILEVGCGAGRFSLHLALQGYNITCLDLSKRQIDKCENEIRNLNIPRSNIKLYCGAIEEFIASSGEASYDTIIGFFILHHLNFKELQSIFKGFYKILKKDGKVCFLEPNRLNLLYFFQILLFPDFNFRREASLYKLSIGSVAKILAKNAFLSARFSNFGFFPPQIINKWPYLINLEKIFESSVLMRPFLPFMLFTANKNE